MVIFDANGSVDFPPMGVNPKQPGLIFKVLISIGNGIARITKWLGGRWDRSNLLPDNPLIRFPDDPEFHEKIWVGSAVPEAAIPLLSTAARQVLKENADLSVMANKRNVIVYDHGSGFHVYRPPGPNKELIRSEILDPADWPEFCQAGVGVINALRKSEVQTRDQRPSRTEIEARLAKITGSRLRPDFAPLPQTEIERFLRHPPPRPIPKSLGRASRSTFSTGSPLSYAVLLVPLIGTIIWVMSVVWELGSSTGRIVGVSLGGVFVLAGLITLVALIVRTLHRRSLLRRGVVVPARIANVKKTGDAITVDKTTWRMYRVMFRYTFRGEPYEHMIGVYGEQAQRAVDLQSSNTPTRILISSHRPQRLFWIDGLISVPNSDDRKSTNEIN